MSPIALALVAGLALAQVLTPAAQPIMPWRPHVARSAATPATTYDFQFLPSAGSYVASSDLCTAFAAELTGAAWWCLKGDGTSQAGGQTLTATGSPVSQTLAASGAPSGVAARHLNGSSMYFYDTASARSGSFSIGASFTYDAPTAGSQNILSSWDADLYFLSQINSSGQITFNGGGAWSIGFVAVVSRAINTFMATYESVGAGTSKAVLYLNGVQVGQKADANVISKGSQRWTVGRRDTEGGSEYLKGNIINAFYTQKVLSPETVRRMAETVRPPLLNAAGNRMYFARASTASFTDAAGRMGVVPSAVPRIVDGAYQNEPSMTTLGYNSEVVTTASAGTSVSAPWTRVAGAGGELYTDGTVWSFAPDGSKTASSSVYVGPTDTSKYAYLGYTASGLSISSVYTASFYTKKDPANGTPGGLETFMASGATAGPASHVISGDAGTMTRIVRTFTATATSAVIGIGNRYSITGVASTTAKQFHIWGMQVEPGSVATSYARQDATPVTRSADDLRWYFGRANYVRDATDLTSGTWSAFNATAVQNTAETMAPDGTQTAAKWASGGSGDVAHYRYTTMNSALTAGRRYMYSVYAKAGTGGRYLVIGRSGPHSMAAFDLQAGTVASVTADANAAHASRRAPWNTTISAAGNDWYRVSSVFTAEDTSGLFMVAFTPTAPTLVVGTNPSYVPTTNIGYLWHPQLEGWDQVDTYSLGPYIPTSGALVTSYAVDRAAMNAKGEARATAYFVGLTGADQNIVGPQNGDRMLALSNSTSRWRTFLPGNVSTAAGGPTTVGAFTSGMSSWSQTGDLVTVTVNGGFAGTSAWSDPTMSAATYFRIGTNSAGTNPANAFVKDVSLRVVP